MKALIIEDEVPAAEKLARYVKRYDNSIDIVNTIDSVAEGVSWLQKHQAEIDLIFMDIQLVDGKSFQIFDKVEITKPVIFTTAFNEYAIDAFKVNSIDYLLKPITFDDLEGAMNKLKNMRQALPGDQPSLNQIVADLGNQKSYKNRFMIKVGDHIKSMVTENITLFYAEGRTAYLVTNEGRRFIIDFKLEDLENILDPALFYRANRTFILNINYIKDVLVYSNSRLKVTVANNEDKDIIVSREKVSTFKSWFDGN